MVAPRARVPAPAACVRSFGAASCTSAGVPRTCHYTSTRRLHSRSATWTTLARCPDGPTRRPASPLFMRVGFGLQPSSVGGGCGQKPPILLSGMQATAAMRDLNPDWRRPAHATSHTALAWTTAHSPLTQGGARAWPWAPPEGHGVPSWRKDRAHLLYPPPPGAEVGTPHHLARAEWGSLTGARVGLF